MLPAAPRGLIVSLSNALTSPSPSFFPVPRWVKPIWQEYPSYVPMFARSPAGEKENGPQALLPQDVVMRPVLTR